MSRRGPLDRLPGRLGDWVREAYRSMLTLLPSAARQPAVGVELHGWLPCWAFRLLAVGLALGSAALVVQTPFGWLVVGVLAALILIRPGSPAAPILVAVLGFSMVQHPDQDWAGRGPLLLLGLHACVTLAVLLGATGWAARVQLRVLASPALRFAVIQLVAQVFGLLGALLAGYDLSWPWLPVVAALLALVLVLLWAPRLARREAPPPSRVEQVVDATARRWGDE
ncbi:hypothetical protein GCM10022236_07810 [Microlunatus ginsengisoli]|uniref:Uncharacterized protein n=2 Tax=Microlunatus ginsengisoli TaxID=363863 RepID=A0ABP6ZG34_9ACTN